MKRLKRSRGERGQVLPLVALCLAVIMGFAGMAVDVGYLEYTQRQQQSATDAAAIGGAQQFVYSGCGSSAGTTAAQKDATTNGYTTGGNTTVAVSIPPSTGSYAGNNCAVQVQITSPHATFFTQLFGYSGGMNETTQAVATIKGSPDCVIMLQPGQNNNFHGANLTAPNCSIQLNGSADFNAATIDAAGIFEGDYSGSNNSGTFTGASPVASLPVADPCPEIAGCAYLTNNPPTTSPCTSTYSGSGPLTPGCYDNLNLNGATVTLQPSSTQPYVFEGSLNMNMANITGNGVTIYIAAGASTNFNKTSSLNLSPPTTGDYTGVTIYQVPGNSNGLNLNSGSSNIQGLFYAPSASLNYNSSGNNYVLLVAAYGNFNNSNGFDLGTPGSGLPYLLHQAVLVQ